MNIHMKIVRKKKVQALLTSSLFRSEIRSYEFFKYVEVSIDRPIFIFNNLENGYIKITIIPFANHVNFTLLSAVSGSDMNYNHLLKNNLYLIHFDKKKYKKPDVQRVLLIEFDYRPF